MKEFYKRVLVAVVGIPLAVFLLYYGGWPFYLAVMIISAVTLYEFYGLAEAKGFYPMKTLGIFTGVLIQITLIIFLSASLWGDIIGSIFVSLMIILMTIIILIFNIFNKKSNPFINLSISLAGILYIPLLFSTLIALREFDVFYFKNIFFTNKLDSDTMYAIFGLLIICLFATVWICDTAAYFVGKSIGKHKLAPQISPKKTWEGAIGGFIGAIAGFFIMKTILIPEFLLFHSIVIGVIVGTVGQLGDLAESKLKRDAGVKDSSNLIPGHGGFLDRFDSLLLVIPTVFIYMVVVSII